jgi:hypothetical protein
MNSEHYRLKKNLLFEGQITDTIRIAVTLKAGEICSYFGHSDTYLFQARSNMIPFFMRSIVESQPDWFEPVELPGEAIPFRGEPAKPRIITESDEYF